MAKLVNHILDAHVVTVMLLLFALAGVEQVIAGKLDYTDLLNSLPAAVAVGGVAVGRGLAAYKK